MAGLSTNGPSAPRVPETGGRLREVDLLRGLAIVLMALDHVREFLQAEQFDPLDLSQTSVPLFFTRWVTHFCPSIFLFLAGAGIALGLSQNASPWRQFRFVLVRGIWLVVLELTAVHFGWFFNVQFQSALGQVIWAIGWSMIGMAGLIFFPAWLVTSFGVALIVFHNAFDKVSPDAFGSYAWLWRFLHAGGPISWGRFSIYIAYPLIPWIGVMAAGFGFGHLLRWKAPLRTPLIMALGMAMIALFVALRGGNIYGNPTDWTPQKTPVVTLLAILNCQKYPPSLAYLLMTLGPILAVWSVWERWRGSAADFLVTFGRVPLFFYVVHLFVIHGLTVGLVYWQTRSLPDWLWGFPPGHAGPGTGVSLSALYLIWAVVVLMHYPLCLWYGRLKAKHPRSVLRFL
jgi:uncharacterized membrane protein